MCESRKINVVAVSNEIRLIKNSGQVFTPDFLVKQMLDFCSYTTGNILHKHIIDNSCGDGAFLCVVVVRYCVEHIRVYGTTEHLAEALETYIHGIELEKTAYDNCVYNLSAIAESFGLTDVHWDLHNTDALTVTEYDHKIDFVVGNPPYVRVHNLAESYANVKSFYFAQGGMTDLYLVFYELGLRMLNTTGRLCYITPSSWLSSLAAANMRSYILTRRNLSALIDLGHYQAFDNATTYTMIALFDMKQSKDTVDYYIYSETLGKEVYEDSLTYEEMTIGSSFYVAKRKDLQLLQAIKTTPTQQYVQVKNGFATLADKVFILGVDFDELTIPVLKASTGRWHKGFFPYNKQGKPFSREEIFAHPVIAKYLNDHKAELLKGNNEDSFPDWYLYGRTQALKDVQRKKYAINTIVRGVESIKLAEVPAGAGLYSGLYILTDTPFEVIQQIICCEDFIKYISMLKNYKSGGYYTYNSKDLEQYLNYKISAYERKHHHIPAYQRELFECAV